MKAHILKLTAAAALLAVGASANAYVETFETAFPNPSVGFTDGQGTFLDSALNGMQYGVATFSSWFASTEAIQGAAYYEPASGSVLAFSPSAGSFTVTDSELISSATPFTFDGAFFSGTAVGVDLVTVGFKLYDGATLVHTTSLTSLPATDGNTFVSSGYAGAITGVVVTGHQGYYGMDDFTYEYTTAVPEPGTVALMIGGLALVGGAARLRRAR